MLFIPSYNKHNVEKAKTVLADTVIFDLEAILQEQREAGRTVVKEVYKEKYGPDGGLDMGSEGPNISVELSPDRKSYKGLVITDF